MFETILYVFAVEEGVDDSGVTAAAERPAMLVEENSEFDGQVSDGWGSIMRVTSGSRLGQN